MNDKYDIRAESLTLKDITGGRAAAHGRRNMRLADGGAGFTWTEKYVSFQRRTICSGRWNKISGIKRIIAVDT